MVHKRGSFKQKPQLGNFPDFSKVRAQKLGQIEKVRDAKWDHV